MIPICVKCHQDYSITYFMNIKRCIGCVKLKYQKNKVILWMKVIRIIFHFEQNTVYDQKVTGF